MDIDNSGHLDQEELRAIFDSPTFRRVFEAFGMNVSMPFEYIWPIIDTESRGAVDFEHFVDACLRMRGTKGKQHYQMMILQGDLQVCGSGLPNRIPPHRMPLARARTCPGSLNSSSY